MSVLQQYIGTVETKNTVYEVYKRGPQLELALAGRTGTVFYGDITQRNYKLHPDLFFQVRDLLQTKQLLPRGS